MALETSRAGGRMTRGLRDAMREVAARNSIAFADLLPQFASHSPNGIIGRSLILDNCHPNVRGHQIMAKAILEAGIASGLIAPNCRLDRFDEVMSQFSENDLSWLADSITEDERKNWPQPTKEITSATYAASTAEWLSDYLREKDPPSSIDWLQKAIDLDPDRESIAEKAQKTKQSEDALSRTTH